VASSPQAVRTGQGEQDWQNRIGRAGQAVQEKQNKVGQTDPSFSPCQVDLGSGTWFPVWCSKGKKKREFTLFFLSRSARKKRWRPPLVESRSGAVSVLKKSY
jgi:hypothetical protein